MIAEKNTRVIIQMDKQKYEKIKKIAEKERRSISNLINVLLENEIKKFN